MEYEEALRVLHAADWKGSRPGLERIAELLRRLGHPERRLRILHVAGTNGKGSVCAMLASILTAAGFRTGLFTSPCLTDLREQLQCDGEPISEAALADVTAQLLPELDAMPDSPTAFERLTAAALLWFSQCGCEVAVLEAGMGGALDATNAVQSKALAVLTHIGLDHTAYLGDTLEEIAAAKAGIVTPGCDCVMYPAAASVQAVVEAACKAQSVPLTIAVPARLHPSKNDLTGQRLTDGTHYYPLPLLGAHQRDNAALVLAAVDVLRKRGWDIPHKAVCEGLARVRWHGRFEVVRTAPLFLLDGGHNAQGIEALCRALDDYLPGHKLRILTGVLADKDYPAMYARLAPYAAEFLCLTPDNPRALPADALAAHLARYGRPVSVPPSVEAAVAKALSGTAPVLACGSLYLASEIMKYL